MKLNIAITGQDERHLGEHIEQLVRARTANTPQLIEADPSPPSQPATRAPTRRDRRS